MILSLSRNFFIFFRLCLNATAPLYLIGDFEAKVPLTPRKRIGVFLTQSVSFGYHPSEKLGFNPIAPLSPSKMDFINTALCAVYHNRAKRWLYHICGGKYIIFLLRNISFHGSAVTVGGENEAFGKRILSGAKRHEALAFARMKRSAKKASVSQRLAS